MYKKIIMILAIAVLLVGVKTNLVFADDTVKSIDLKSATDCALKNNDDIKLLNEKISLTQNRYDKAAGENEQKARSKELEDYRWQLDNMKKNIAIDVPKLYHSVLIKQNQVALQKDIAARLNKEYDSKKKEVELGKSSQSSLIQQQINIADAQSKLIGLENDLSGLIMDLNIEMGEDIKQKLSLADVNLTDETLDIQKIDEIALKLPNLDHSVLSSLKDLDNLKEQQDGSSGDAYLQIEDKIRSLKYDINDKKESIECQVYTNYNNLLNLRDGMQINKLGYDQDNNLANIADIKYKYGLISSLEYDKAKQDLLNSKYTYEQSKLDYYIEIKKYKLFIEPVQK